MCPWGRCCLHYRNHDGQRRDITAGNQIHDIHLVFVLQNLNHPRIQLQTQFSVPYFPVVKRPSFRLFLLDACDFVGFFFLLYTDFFIDAASIFTHLFFLSFLM